MLLWRSLWTALEHVTFDLGTVVFVLGFGGLAVNLWPCVLPRHITIWDRAAGPTTQTIIAVGVIIVLPIVLAYLAYAYWIFRGKTAQAYDQEAPATPLAACRRMTSMPIDLNLS